MRRMEAAIQWPPAHGLRVLSATALADRLNLEFALINRKRKRDVQNGNATSSLYTVPSTPYTHPATPAMPNDPMSGSFMGMAALSLGSAAGGGGNGGGSNAGSLAGSMHGTLVPPSAEDDEDGKVEKMELLVGDVKGKIAILVDDMIDTGHTVRLAAEVLVQAGAKEVYALISHGGSPTCAIAGSLLTLPAQAYCPTSLCATSRTSRSRSSSSPTRSTSRPASRRPMGLSRRWTLRRSLPRASGGHTTESPSLRCSVRMAGSDRRWYEMYEPP